MILLEVELSGPLPFGQVSFTSDLLSRKLYLSWTTGQDLFQALVYSYVMVQFYQPMPLILLVL